MADASRTASPAKASAFNRMYFILLAALVVVVLGLYLLFATTRQPHGATSGAGTQKGMVAAGNPHGLPA